MRFLPMILCVLLAACVQQPPKDDSLYRDLGEQEGITRIVETMLLNVARDARIVEHFRRVDIQRLRDKLVERLCVEAGGPCVYSGDSMAESHKGKNISRSEFNALVEDLIAAMDEQGIAVPVQNRLIARLAALRPEVIEQ